MWQQTGKRIGLTLLMAWTILLSVGWASLGACCDGWCACQESTPCIEHCQGHLTVQASCSCHSDEGCQGCTPTIEQHRLDNYTSTEKASLPEPMIREIEPYTDLFASLLTPLWNNSLALRGKKSLPLLVGRLLLSHICILRI